MSITLEPQAKVTLELEIWKVCNFGVANMCTTYLNSKQVQSIFVDFVTANQLPFTLFLLLPAAVEEFLVQNCSP